MIRLRLGIAVIVAMLATPIAFASPVAAARTDLLPDLQMAPLYGIQLSTTAAGYRRLRFGTTVYNVGDGPIEVRGGNRVGNEMTLVEQWIKRSDGTGHGVLKPDARIFYSGDGHDHFHIRRFITAKLKSLPGNLGGVKERRGRKIGFCLVDGLKMKTDIPPNATGLPAYFGCGDIYSQHIQMGISVGWGDFYGPYLAFQTVDVTNLPRGSYRLCVTVNPKSIWEERGGNNANNSYWVDIELDVAGDNVSVTDAGATPCP